MNPSLSETRLTPSPYNLATQPVQGAFEREDIESPEDTWFGQDSGNDAAEQRGTKSGNGLKRKRPNTVSYVKLH